MNSIYLLLSATPRSGNTFLSRCLMNAININKSQTHDIQVSSHLHAPAVLAFEQSENIKIYTSFRDPKETVISSTLHKMFYHKGSNYKFNGNFTDITYNIDKAVREYTEYLNFQKKYKHATVIMFEKLIKDPHYIIENILKDCGIEYNNKISIEGVKLGIKSEDANLYTNGKGDFATTQYHIPHNIEQNPVYPYLQDKLPLLPVFKQLNTLYEETIEELKKSDCKIYE